MHVISTHPLPKTKPLLSTHLGQLADRHTHRETHPITPAHILLARALKPRPVERAAPGREGDLARLGLFGGCAGGRGGHGESTSGEGRKLGRACWLGEGGSGTTCTVALSGRGEGARGRARGGGRWREVELRYGSGLRSDSGGARALSRVREGERGRCVDVGIGVGVALALGRVTLAARYPVVDPVQGR